MSEQVTVAVLPACDICKSHGVETTAMYDAKTVYGPWAYLCDQHFQQLGPDRLGTGFGQLLVLRQPSKKVAPFCRFDQEG